MKTLFKKNIYNSEHDEQVLLCKYLDFKKLPYFAIPNGFPISIFIGKLKGFNVANWIIEKVKICVFSIIKKMKTEGMQNGISDIAVFLPDFILFIEMKKVKGGTLSPDQKKWIEIINKYSYSKAIVCHGFEEAREYIERCI